MSRRTPSMTTGTSSRMTTPAIEQVALRLPDWMGSIRFRLTVLYSIVLFGLAVTLVGGLYLALAARLDDEPMARSSARDAESIDGLDRVRTEELASFEEGVNRRALQLLRSYSFAALGLLFLASLGVGWLVAGRVLAPIDRITAVARDIQATDLSRRIELRGPPDELKDLADTFDDMLGRLDEAFGQQRRFIQEASHELRNPLAVIRTNLDVVLADSDADEGELREAAEVVNRSAARMAVLVDDLLAYAREGAPHRDVGPVDLGAIVDESVADLGVAAAARSLDLIPSPPDPPVVVVGDRVALRQAVANLAGNAVRLAPEGTSVLVGAGIDGPWAWVAVDDAGPGIAPEDRERVFEWFWRGDQRAARTEGRSGMGLPIVEQIATAHRGEVHLAPNDRGGSTFTIWLPGGVDAPVAEGPLPDSEPGARRSGSKPGERSNTVACTPEPEIP